MGYNALPDDSEHDPVGTWELNGSVAIVASNTVTNEFEGVGVGGKVDLIFDGLGLMNQEGAEGDTVYFRPETITDVQLLAAGNDWGGAMLTPFANGSTLRFVDIGYAANPLFISYGDLTTVAHARIHSFADVGIWIRESAGAGAFIDTCVVDRGTTLSQTLGDTGILLDKADHVSILDSQVLLHGLLSATGGTGISTVFSKAFCQAGPPAPRRLMIKDNFIMGPGELVLTGSAYTGLRMSWPCGSSLRDIDVLENWIEDQKYAGMELLEPSDVQITCNRVEKSQRGVDVFRTSQASGPEVRMRENLLEVLTPDPNLFAVRTNDALNLKLGPNQTDRGWNRLTVNFSSTKFIYELDANQADSLNAENTFWYTKNGANPPVRANQIQIVPRLSPPGVHGVDFNPYMTNDGTACAGAVRPGDAPAANFPLNRVGPAREEGLAVDPHGLPSAFLVTWPAPNPGSRFELMLDVPAEKTGEYVLDVFDIHGRRLAQSRHSQLSPGRARLSWVGRDSDGRSVAAGVYFLRLTGPGDIVQTRKVTVLR